MPGWVLTDDVPGATWVGLGNDRRYLLAYDDVSGRVFAWFQVEGGWDHTLDSASPVQPWRVHEEADPEVWASLVSHVTNIEPDGCGARGYCRSHASA